MKIENLWTSFFRAKYLKDGHLATTKLLAMGSQLWKKILKKIMTVYKNVYLKVLEGKISFCFDKWFKNGPLASYMDSILQPALKIHDYWVDGPVG